MTVVFDFGGVIVDLRKEAAVAAFRDLGFDLTPYLGTYKQQGVFSLLENGDIALPDFYEEIRRTSGRDKLTDTDIRNAWEAYLTGVPTDRLECLLRVKHHYRTAVLSNTNPIHWRQGVERFFAWQGHRPKDYFDDFFLSYELHLQKPDPALFALITDRLGGKPDEIVFFDDSAENCRIATDCGWQARCVAAGGSWVTEEFTPDGRLRHE